MVKSMHPTIDGRKAVKAEFWLYVLRFFHAMFSLAKIKKTPFYD